MTREHEKIWGPNLLLLENPNQLEKLVKRFMITLNDMHSIYCDSNISKVEETICHMAQNPPLFCIDHYQHYL